MSKSNTDEATLQHTLRLWPGVMAAIFMLFIRFVLPTLTPETPESGVLGAFLCSLLIIVWWAFFSRAPRTERLIAVVFIIATFIITPYMLHESIVTSMMGMMFPIFSLPTLSLAFVIWAVASRHMPSSLQRTTMIATIVLASCAWALVKTGGFDGNLQHDFSWRWADTHEDRLLAQTSDASMANTSVAIAANTEADWPGFRGPNRDGIIRGIQIETNWSASPPTELWRHLIGPGWSSFAVHGDLLYTQEQRGDDEVVACYTLTTGEPVWKHRDPARFWEANAGAGPRATPTLKNGRVYTLGATGILNVLNATDGTVIWSRNAVTDTQAKIPGWGIASSPLVVNDLVIVATNGALVAYDINTGTPRWFGPKEGYGYSSPHLLTFDGITHIVLSRGDRITSVSPTDGKLLWEHPLPSGTSIVQPAQTPNGDLLLSDGEKSGMRRISILHTANEWTTEERWETNRLKPYFSDFVIHNDHAYGFDGNILACIDIATGKRKWKGGRYGQGQLILLADQNILLVLSEHGELKLVSATADQFTELAHSSALEGKTWNHPVLIGNTLLVRNGEEMVAFKLTLTDS